MPHGARRAIARCVGDWVGWAAWAIGWGGPTARLQLVPKLQPRSAAGKSLGAKGAGVLARKKNFVLSPDADSSTLFNKARARSRVAAGMRRAWRAVQTAGRRRAAWRPAVADRTSARPSDRRRTNAFSLALCGGRALVVARGDAAPCG